MANVDREAVLRALKTVKDPALNRDIVSLNFIRDLEINGGSVRFKIVLNQPASPVKVKLEEAAREAATLRHLVWHKGDDRGHKDWQEVH